MFTKVIINQMKHLIKVKINSKLIKIIIPVKTKIIIIYNHTKVPLNNKCLMIPIIKCKHKMKGFQK